MLFLSFCATSLQKGIHIKRQNYIQSSSQSTRAETHTYSVHKGWKLEDNKYAAYCQQARPKYMKKALNLLNQGYFSHAFCFSFYLNCWVWGVLSVFWQFVEFCLLWSFLTVGLYRRLVKVSWLGKLVSVFWWVELDFFSLECNKMPSFWRQWAAFLGAWCPLPALRSCFVEFTQRLNVLLMNLCWRKWSPRPIPPPS